MKFEFSTLNFETLDVNLNAHPDIFINLQGVTFTRKALDVLGYPGHILCMLDQKNCVFAVRPCKSNEGRAFKFSKPKEEQKSSICITNKNLLGPLRQCMGDKWQEDKRYRVRGFWVADAKTLCFDLSEAKHEDFFARKETTPEE